jgi:hypothetical protein
MRETKNRNRKYALPPIPPFPPGFQEFCLKYLERTSGRLVDTFYAVSNKINETFVKLQS